MQVNTLSEQLLFTTVRITTKKGAASGLGTGFFFGDVDQATNTGQLFLVTNKHVIKGAHSAELHFIAGSGGAPLLGQEHSVALGDPEQAFKGHADPEIDVAMMPIGALFNVLGSSGKEIFFRCVSPELCADNAKLDPYEPIEPVTFIGYPNGLHDTKSLLPIVRRGHSATALTVDYEGKPQFLIDASVFPGSSGSPVFLTVPASAPDKYGNITIGAPPKILFLGVVAAVYHRNVPVLTSASKPFTNEMLDIGIVYKASTVLQLRATF